MPVDNVSIIIRGLSAFPYILSVIPVDYLTEILAENIIFIKVKEISESHNL